MKIASMAPNIVVEVPPAVDAEETERVGRELRHLKLVELQPAASSSGDSALEEETRAGIHRLADLLREHKKRQKEGKRAPVPALRRELAVDDPVANDQRRKIALAQYQKIIDFKEPTEELGIVLDKVS